MNKILPQTLFENFFISKVSQHLCNTRRNSLDVLQVKAMTLRYGYGSNSFTLHAIHAWNFFQKTKSESLLHCSLI